MRLLVLLMGVTLTLTCLAAGAPGRSAPPAPPGREEMLYQAQAADVLGAALTDAVGRATAEANASKNATTAPAAARKHPTYREVFDQTVARLKKQGDSALEPTLKQLPSSQLFEEMTVLQTYNLAQYMRLTRLLDTLHARRVPTTLPALATLGDNFTPGERWLKQRQEVRNAIIARHNASRSTVHQPTGQTAAAAHAQPGLADDPRFQPYFYGTADAMTGWNDDYGFDPYTFRGGGGVYRRSDTRVNRYYDVRTQGQFDRRINIEADRRLNIHVDPRDNF